jgi:deoxyribodipyrimidine photo-lyase
MSKKITIFWFRQDLRIADNPGLYAAALQGKVLPIYILDDDTPGEFKLGGASRWWLNHSLNKLNQDLKNNLNVYTGQPKKILLNIIKENNIDAVYWNRCYEPWRIKQDTEIKLQLKNMAIDCESFNASLLWEPWQVLKSDGTPYKVYTPYYKNGCLQAIAPRQPLPKPKKLDLIKINDSHINLLPKTNWYESLASTWAIGEKAAHKKLDYFLEHYLSGYKKNRDYPAKPNTSRMSPHLHFGEISPQQIWHTVNHYEDDAQFFLRELAWREFSYYLLYHFPDLPRKNFQAKFDTFPWKNNKKYLRAWQQGQTGYPIIDAGMRELWQTGYMHNRVRMIVASFLVKNLQIHWHQGESWFWDCLVDADLASNSASWQWVAGSGADAAPYFRIFNPVIQGEKFDKEGEYTRRFVPELAGLPNKYLFKPWTAPASVLNAAGIILGKTYPHPIVDLKQTRENALLAWKNISNVHTMQTS